MDGSLKNIQPNLIKHRDEQGMGMQRLRPSSASVSAKRMRHRPIAMQELSASREYTLDWYQCTTLDDLDCGGVNFESMAANCSTLALSSALPSSPTPLARMRVTYLSAAAEARERRKEGKLSISPS